MGDLTGPGAFAADDGSVPPDVADVLARRASGHAGIREVVMCLTAHRLIVPLLEVDGDLLEGDDTDPCAGSDRAVAAVSMRDPEGRPLGLAFTGMAPLVGVGRLGTSAAGGGLACGRSDRHGGRPGPCCSTPGHLTPCASRASRWLVWPRGSGGPTRGRTRRCARP